MAADRDVIAALRLVVEATNDWAKLGRVANVILQEAPGTPDNNTGGLAILLDLQRNGSLDFDVDAEG